MTICGVKRAGPLQIAILAAAILIGLAQKTLADGDERVLSIGGSVTEIVFALGAGDRLVGRDTTSAFPEAALALPDVGYVRALSPEGVLSVEPDLILAVEGSGPPEAMEVLGAADLDLTMIPEGFDGAAIAAKIAAVAAALDLEAEGAALIAQTQAALAEAVAAAETDDPMRVMFILSMQGGRILASGTGTAADGIIALAGAENAVAGFEGYLPVSEEAVIAAAPDVILMMDRNGDHSASDEQLFEHPAIALTPAAETRSVVRIDGLLLLGFGPRTPEAVGALSAALADPS